MKPRGAVAPDPEGEAQFDALLADYRQIETLFFADVLALALRYRTTLRADAVETNNAESYYVRARLNGDQLVVEVFGDDDTWQPWGSVPLSDRVYILSEAGEVLRLFDAYGHGMVSALTRARQQLVAWSVPR